MKKSILFLLLSATVLCVVSCKKGDTGAQGPQGNANVVSYNYVITPGSWYTYGTPGSSTTGYGYEVQISDPDITADVVANGAVVAYFINSDGSISALPYTIAIGSALTRTYTYTANTGVIFVDYEDSDFQTTAPAYNYTFKIVAIAGAQLAKRHITPQQVQTMSYSKVNEVFHLTK